MKVLSVRQPWASAIIHGGKDIENRTWDPGQRLKSGDRFAIHASAGNPNKDEIKYFTNQYGLIVKPMPSLVFGCIIGTAKFVECLDATDEHIWDDDIGDYRTIPRAAPSEWAENHMAYTKFFWWRLADSIPCEPIPIKGSLGIWNIDDNLIKELP